MAGRVEHRRGVGRCRVVDLQLVVARQRIGYRDVEVPGISLLAVGRAVGEGERRVSFGRGELLRLPDAAFESAAAAVQVVLSVVDREPVLPAVEREPALADPVSVAAHDRTAVVVRGGDIVSDLLEPPYDVPEHSVGRRNPKGDDPGTVVGDLYRHPVVVAQRIEAGLPAVDLGAERFVVEQFDSVAARSVCAGTEQNRSGQEKENSSHDWVCVVCYGCIICRSGRV